MFCRRCYRNRGCYKNSSQNEINFEQLKNMVSKGAILIDVRSPQEFNEGHLPGAINIPEYEIRKVKNEMPKLNQQIVVYCQYGGRSREAYNMLRKMGYTNVYSLKGGLEMI
jgi:rhodanese-related sulfurtransferase